MLPGSHFECLIVSRPIPANGKRANRTALHQGRKEAAQQFLLGELLQPSPPALRAAPQPIKDPRELARNRGLAVAAKPAGVIDQEPIASQ